MQYQLNTESMDTLSTATTALPGAFRARFLDCGGPVHVKEEPLEEQQDDDDDDDEGMVIDLTPRASLPGTPPGRRWPEDQQPSYRHHRHHHHHHYQGQRAGSSVYSSTVSKNSRPKARQGGEGFQQVDGRFQQGGERFQQGAGRYPEGGERFQQSGGRFPQGSERSSQRTDEGFVTGTNANIPYHLHAIDDDGSGGVVSSGGGSVLSDSETSSQGCERVSGSGNGNGSGGGGGGGSSSSSSREDMVKGAFRFSVPQPSLPLSSSQSRAKREFVPDHKKDTQYWSKRSKNNLSARRSRFKRKTLEKVMEMRMVELQEENIKLRYELKALKRMFGDKVATDLTCASSPDTSSTWSSGLGTSKSDSSSSGSADHSTSSSPTARVDEDKHKKVGFQLKVKLASVQKERARELKKSAGFHSEDKLAPRVEKRSLGDEHFQNPDDGGGGGSGVCSLNAHADKNSPPAAHAHFLSARTAYAASGCSPAKSSHASPCQATNSPPPAHNASAYSQAPSSSSSSSSSSSCSSSSSSSYFFSAFSGFANPSPFFARHNSPNDFFSSAVANNNAVGFSHQRLPYGHNAPPIEASSGSDDPGFHHAFPSEQSRYCRPISDNSSGSPGSPSDDDGSSSTGSLRSWRGSQEEEDRHKIPLKCRMKRELNAAFSAAAHSVSKNAAVPRQ